MNRNLMTANVLLNHVCKTMATGFYSVRFSLHHGCSRIVSTDSNCFVIVLPERSV